MEGKNEGKNKYNWKGVRIVDQGHDENNSTTALFIIHQLCDLSAA